MISKRKLQDGTINIREEFLIKFPKLNHHWLCRYVNFINNRKAIHIKGNLYTETHHILPKVGFEEYYLYKSNLIELTPREHFIAHLILAYLLGGKYWFSVNLMVNAENPFQQRKAFTKINSKLLDKIRKECSVYSKEQMLKIRSEESETTKLLRVKKWKETQASKSEEEKTRSIQKQKETKQKNRERGLHKQPIKRGIGKKSWYNDGVQNYCLLHNDPSIEILSKGRIPIKFTDVASGSKWFNNGIINIRLYPNDPRVLTFYSGVIKKENNRGISKNTKWFNDGIKCYRLKDNDPKIVELNLKIGKKKV